MVIRRSGATLSLVTGQEGRSASDGDLARALMAGNSWAIAETWRRFAPMVLLLAKRTLGSPSEADDIGQEVFFRVFRKARRLREPDRLRSFVYAIAVRALQTELRRRKLRGWLHLERPESLAALGNPTVDTESRDLLRRFEGLLDRLTPRERLVWVLKRMEAMTVEEIAVSMEISESTVKRCLARASERLSRWIRTDAGLASYFDGERLKR